MLSRNRLVAFPGFQLGEDGIFIPNKCKNKLKAEREKWKAKRFPIRRRGMRLASRSKISRFGFDIGMIVFGSWCGIFRREEGGRFLNE